MTEQAPPTFTAPGAARRDNDEPFATTAYGMPDSDLPVRRVDDPTPLDAIAAELAADVAETTTLEIPARPGWSAIYSLDVNHETLGVWRKAAADKQQPDGVNELRYACIILANLNTGIIRGGRLVEVAGETLTWRSAEMRQMLGVARTVDAVRKAYGRDAHIIAASKAVLEGAGYGTEAVEDQPLDGEANPT